MGNGIIRKNGGNLNGFSEKVRMSDSIYITEKRFNSKVNKLVQNNTEPSTESFPNKHFTDRIHYLTGPLLYDNLKRGLKLKDLLQKSHYINIMENLELIKGLSFNISNYLDRMELSGILTKDLAITLKRSIQAIDTAFVKRISSIDLSNNRINSRTLIIIKRLVCIYHLIKYLKEEGAFQDGKWWRPLTNEKYGEILSQKIEEKCEAILENYDKSDNNSKDSSDLGDKDEIIPSEDTIIQNIKAAEIEKQQIIAKNQRISNKIMIIEKDLDKIEEELNSGTLETSRNGIGNDSDLMAMSIRKDFIEEKINIESHIKECSSEIKELTNKLRVVFGRSNPPKLIPNSKINKKLTNTPPPKEIENDVKLMNMVKEYLEITFENILSEF